MQAWCAMFMRKCLLLSLVVALPVSAELGGDLRPALGKPAPADFESVVMPDGAGLPAGQGSVAAGEEIYAFRCAACHGADGRLAGNQLVGGEGTLASARPLKTVGSYWPYATTLFDYVGRAMPYGDEKSLTVTERYSVVAYVLHLNGIVGADETLDQDSLPKVEMPNREGFFEAQDFASD